MKFNTICAVVKEMSVHTRIHVHQTPFSDGKASNKKKDKKKFTSVRKYMYKVELFH